MPDKGGDLSMFNKVEEHGELINRDILPRLDEVEKVQKEFKNSQEEIKTEMRSIKSDVSAIRSAQSSMELAVYKDGAQTRDLLNKFVEHYFNADGKAFVSKEKVTVQKLSTKEKVWLAIIAVFASGGFATLGSIITSYINR